MANFLDTIRASAATARVHGAIFPIETSLQVIQDHEISFVVRVARNLERKAQFRRTADAPNPFLPYDPEMFVTDLSETHVCLLNKFNVVDDHVLIVTRDYVSQDTALDLSDFHALLNVATQFPSLSFYNSGTIAGASQPHKHLQVVPLPLGNDDEDVPLAPRFQLQRRRAWERFRSADLPWNHRLVRLDPDLWDDSQRLAQRLHEVYWLLLGDLGWSHISEQTPYNLLLTGQFMCIVPRRLEEFAGISVNSLGYAGGFFVKTTEQLDLLRQTGPLSILAKLAG